MIVGKKIWKGGQQSRSKEIGERKREVLEREKPYHIIKSGL